MRTTVDIDPAILEGARRVALGQRRTLGAVLSDALAAYLGSRKEIANDPPFELLVRGRPTGRLPKPAEMRAIDDEDETVRLRTSGRGSRGSP